MTHESALKTAHGKRAEARARLDTATLAVTESQRAETYAKEQVTQRSQELESAQTRPAYELASTALESAKVDHLLAAKELKAKQTALALVQSDVQKAEGAVEAAADQILAAEAQVIAAEIHHHLDEAIHKGKALRSYIGDAIIGTYRATIGKSVESALARVPPRDDLNTPVNQLLENITRQDIEFSKHRAALIDGEAA